jgi:hypothetical protein
MMDSPSLFDQVAELRNNLKAAANDLIQKLSDKLLQSQAGRFLGSGVTTISSIDSGDTAWMIIATGLVLFMSIPGLALFYGGMSREKNVLSTAMQTFTIACLVTVTWISFGYSLSFAPAVPDTRTDHDLKHNFHVRNLTTVYLMYL